ncbi:MAG: GTPase HflX [Pseudomonadales bacterium]|nr:GTPase HflX [Pseudomonadales bacterium]
MFFDRPKSGELAVLVHLDIGRKSDEAELREFEELALSAGADPVDFLTGQRASPDPRYFIGTGKLEEIRSVVEQSGAELVVFNHTLSPSQERNLEKVLCCRVLDRTGLILDIFAQRARTHEGKLQVELAQLRHISTRLVRGWTHLERQKGGIGLRGPGETQLETDRRLLRVRINSIEARLGKVRKQREQGRRSRKRNELPTVALVGYTNAGKSTLFNALSNADVYAADQLFATLDPTMRFVTFDDVGKVILADTVGFVSHLPHQLVQAFRATLEEVSNADLLLHVVDASSAERDMHIHEVQEVLREIGAAEVPQLLVMNKIDLVDTLSPGLETDQQGAFDKVRLSSKTGEGLDLLKQSIVSRLAGEMVDGCCHLKARQLRLRSRLYEKQAVCSEHMLDDGSMRLHIRLPRIDFLRLLKTEGLRESEIMDDGNGLC